MFGVSNRYSFPSNWNVAGDIPLVAWLNKSVNFCSGVPFSFPNISKIGVVSLELGTTIKSLSVFSAFVSGISKSDVLEDILLI